MGVTIKGIVKCDGCHEFVGPVGEVEAGLIVRRDAITGNLEHYHPHCLDGTVSSIETRNQEQDPLGHPIEEMPRTYAVKTVSKETAEQMRRFQELAADGDFDLDDFH